VERRPEKKKKRRRTKKTTSIGCIALTLVDGVCGLVFASLLNVSTTQ
jgi:hypothetical protein